ncbi:MAG: glutaminyl-peptide cyclotransferase [Acidobacteriaceae bacterium]
MRRALLLAITLLLTLTCTAQTPTPVYGYKVVATFPHSTSSYTEGFFYLDGHFYEGTGLKGQSQLLVEDPATGHVLQHIDIPPQYFGEGIVNWGPNLYEWTWQSHIGWVYNRATLRKLATFTYTGEGWGMTHDATHIITDDGTAIIRFRDPKDFHEVRNITVTDQGSPVTELNELEYIHGEIYANVWHTNHIARISPRDGHVIAWIDLTGLLPGVYHLGDEAVLNGIAYDAQHDRLFVTGKQWPTIFQIKLVPPSTHK